MKTKNGAQWRARIPLLALAIPAFGVAAEETVLPEIQVTAQQEGGNTTDVEGSAGNAYRNRTATAGPLGRIPLADTPYSMNVTSGALFENRGAHTVSEALKTNPAVSTLMESSGYSSMSRVMIRGFTAADQSDLRDGLVDRSFTFVPLENVERIEVLNGFSGFLYGFSALGGSINYIGKQPTASPYSSAAAGQYGGGVNYLHGDFGGPLDHGGCWRYRVNAYGENGKTSLDGSHQKRGLISGVLDFNGSPDTRWRLDFWKQRLEMRGLQTYINTDPANGVFVPRAARFDATRQYGQDWTYNEAEKSLIGLGVESKLNDTFTVRAAGRYGKMWRDYLYVGATLIDNGGAYSTHAIGSTRQHETTRSAYALVDADFHSGPIAHQLTFGYTGTMFSYTRGDDMKATLGISHVRAPLEFDDPHFAIGPTNYWTRSNYDNWMIGDRLQFDDAWSALIGFNHAILRQRSHGTGTALAVSNFRQRKLTPSYALMFKPRQRQWSMFPIWKAWQMAVSPPPRQPTPMKCCRPASASNMNWEQRPALAKWI
jgi:iron complex outermembrane receptor protein